MRAFASPSIMLARKHHGVKMAVSVAGSWLADAAPGSETEEPKSRYQAVADGISQACASFDKRLDYSKPSSNQIMDYFGSNEAGKRGLAIRPDTASKIASFCA